MTYTRPLHTQDQDCNPDADGNCLCGVTAGDPCPDCFAVRFHLTGCPSGGGPELGPMLPTAVALARGILPPPTRLERAILAFWAPDVLG